MVFDMKGISKAEFNEQFLPNSTAGRGHLKKVSGCRPQAPTGSPQPHPAACALRRAGRRLQLLAIQQPAPPVGSSYEAGDGRDGHPLEATDSARTVISRHV